MKKALASTLLLAAAWCAPPAAMGAPDLPYEWTGIKRIVAIGDVHGAFDNMVAVLQKTGLVDDRLHWIGGETHLVQVGDVVDRGADSRKCMDLLMDLEKQAKKTGGYVHVLIGNHEAMNIVGILDYTSAGEFASYESLMALETWDRALEIYREDQRKEAAAAGKKPPPDSEVRQVFEAKYPKGYFGHREAFGPKGKYGKWIREHNVSVRINGIVFSHGDWSEEMSALGIEEVNRRVRAELSGKAPIEEGVTFALKGVLQFRGLAEVPLTREQQEAHRETVDRTLANLRADRIVVGHTTTEGLIEPRFGGKHISIDVGMLEIYRGGHRVALEVEGDSFRAIHPAGKVDLPAYLDETTAFDYLVAVAAVDPTNVNVYDRLSREYRSRGNLVAARDALEHLFGIDKSLPFRYRRDLGDLNLELGDREKAGEQYRLYIDGLRSLIEVTPENPHLKNLLARFCLEHNMELNLAEQNLRAALQAEPDNPAFLTTFGRLQYVLHQYPEAVETLGRLTERGQGGYEAYYYAGLAYLALKDLPRARKAFETAIQKDPTRWEAREELRRLDATSGQPRGEKGDGEDSESAGTMPEGVDSLRHPIRSG